MENSSGGPGDGVVVANGGALVLADTSSTQPSVFELDQDNALQQYNPGASQHVLLDTSAGEGGNEYPLVDVNDSSAAGRSELVCSVGSYVSSAGGYAFTCNALINGAQYGNFASSTSTNDLFLSNDNPDNGFTVLTAVVYDAQQSQCQ